MFVDKIITSDRPISVNFEENTDGKTFNVQMSHFDREAVEKMREFEEAKYDFEKKLWTLPISAREKIMDYFSQTPIFIIEP